MQRDVSTSLDMTSARHDSVMLLYIRTFIYPSGESGRH